MMSGGITQIKMTKQIPKVLWISDLSLKHHSGGAQRSDFALIEYAQKNLKVIIDEFHIDTPLTVLHKDYDLVIVGNLFLLYQKYPNLIRHLKLRKYIKLEHDSNSYMSQVDRYELFTNAYKSIFLSNTHLDFFRKVYGQYFNNTHIVCDPIDTNRFYDWGKNDDYYSEREDVTLFVGLIHPLKGIEEFMKLAVENPSKRYAVAGFAEDNMRDLEEKSKVYI